MHSVCLDCALPYQKEKKEVLLERSWVLRHTRTIQMTSDILRLHTCFGQINFHIASLDLFLSSHHLSWQGGKKERDIKVQDKACTVVLPQLKLCTYHYSEWKKHT